MPGSSAAFFSRYPAVRSYLNYLEAFSIDTAALNLSSNSLSHALAAFSIILTVSDWAEVLSRAAQLSKEQKLPVLPVSWPEKGGNPMKRKKLW